MSRVVGVANKRPPITARARVVGRDFFPEIDGGQIKLHVRAPAATRIA
jgi:hypothetical protein